MPGSGQPTDAAIGRGMLLVVFKQPGANVIQTVDRIKAALPRLRGRHPAAASMSTSLVDRTQTIRASVKDVEITLLITIVAGGRR